MINICLRDAQYIYSYINVNDICTLQHLYAATFVRCNICTLQHLYAATFVRCNTRISSISVNITLHLS